jgi:hypothetical protein
VVTKAKTSSGGRAIEAVLTIEGICGAHLSAEARSPFTWGSLSR